MVEVKGDAERLTVSQGPGQALRLLTFVCSVAVLVAITHFVNHVVSGSWNTPWGIATLGLPLLLLGVLVASWSNAEYRFDRGAALLLIGHGLRQIERRAAKIADPAARDRYLTQRHENRRARELEKSWFRAGPVTDGAGAA